MARHVLARDSSMQQVEAAGIGTPAAELPGGHEVQRLEAQIDAARGRAAEDELVAEVRALVIDRGTR